MQIKTLIPEIKNLSLDKRFLIIEQTLQSIKNQELNLAKVPGREEVQENYSGDKNFKDVFINEKSLVADRGR